MQRLNVRQSMIAAIFLSVVAVVTNTVLSSEPMKTFLVWFAAMSVLVLVWALVLRLLTRPRRTNAGG